MKKSLLVILVLSLALVFAVGCTSDEPEVYEEPVVEEVIEEPVVEATPDSIQDFVDEQNELYGAINTDELTVTVRAEGTTVIFDYTFGFENLDEGMMQELLDGVSDEGQVLLDTTRLLVPELTAITFEYRDADGTDLGTTTFE
ncbi:MAG: hypothetical protein FWE48_00875 [Coriobacteriia bacterium]|nr:hypothetical protein [Coriobacteriia bacterium]MCL2745635.1 hypothetical protein [Coriobacteriia bacterium]MCL2870496.1 hypothetical protein [Coriobacteriia bacterium]